MKAAIYLRVSTLDQVGKSNTNRDGFSIPAQREACRKKAESLEVATIREYVDRGESARSADRPALQRLLRDLCAKKQFDYVIVHKLDRLARDVQDDVMISLAIKKGGAQLVSVTENIDETPSGRLLHGIMATIAEFYSRNLALEALKGATEKAKQGGTPYFAPVGYLNIIESSQKRENRTVVPDPERVALVRWGMERYATGDYSERELQEELARRGLRARGRSMHKPLSLSAVDRMLSNRYYLGYVTYCGIEYKGNHQPLVTPAVFAAVQAVRVAHRSNLGKQRKHYHYLTRLIRCGRCHGYLCLAIAKHKYHYFFCMNRPFKCDLPYIPVSFIEDTVVKAFSAVQFSKTEKTQLTADISRELEGECIYAERDIAEQNHRIERLTTQRDSLLQAYYGNLIQPSLLKSEQKRIVKELHQAERVIAEAKERLSIVQNRKAKAVDLAETLELGTAFQNASPIIQRHFCKAFFTCIEIDDQVVDHVRGRGTWREHRVGVTKTHWCSPLHTHQITEAILALSLDRPND